MTAPSVFPGGLDNIATDKLDATPSLSVHPDHHNLLASAVNAIEASLTAGVLAQTPAGAAGGALSGSYPNPGLVTVTAAKGGTGLITLVAGQLLVGNGTAPIIQDAGLAWDNSTKTLSVGAGGLALTAAVSQIVPGATSLALRNNANNANNLIITDAGAVTVRAGLTVTAGGLTVSAGNVGIGVAPLTYAALYTTMATSGSSTHWGVLARPVAASDATGAVYGFEAGPATVAASFTAPIVAGFHAASPTKGAGSTITSAYGLLVDSITSGNTNCYGIYVGAPSGGSGQNLGINNQGGQLVNGAGTTVGFYGSLGTTRTAVTGAKGGNGALGSLLGLLVALNLITDSTTA